MGSATSHVAILARGLGIPAVAGIDPRVLDLAPGTRVVLDGDAGTLKPAPSAEEEAAITTRRAADETRRASELAAAAEPATTRDGHRVEVVANIGDVEEAKRVPGMGGEGVGLLRSEFVFMERRTAPDEDEQTRIYREIARALGPERILVIRTLDVGGDKPLPYMPVGAEANPFLGERGIRLTLARPEIFRTQVRAILRASTAGRVAIMFPMVATLAEWRAGKALVEQERAALGVPPIQVGIMVETASAALMAERFAREADFLSIGTNDLTQYTLAMDRTNPRLAPLVDALHPSVLRLIERTVSGAHAHGKWVGVCGALAGDRLAVPVLVGLGVDELSADVPIVPAVKARVRTLSLEECRETARLALDAEDGAAVRRIVEERHGQANPGSNP
jgi:phosphocarrier protein FPr